MTELEEAKARYELSSTRGSAAAVDYIEALEKENARLQAVMGWLDANGIAKDAYIHGPDDNRYYLYVGPYAHRDGLKVSERIALAMNTE
jgi:hypothetical protein